MRNRGINPMESGLGLWLGINLVFTFAIPGISIGGHLGGLIGGALAAFLMFDLRDRIRMPPLMPRRCSPPAWAWPACSAASPSPASASSAS